MNGCINMPQEEKLPARYLATRNIIPKRLKELVLQGKKWDF